MTPAQGDTSVIPDSTAAMIVYMMDPATSLAATTLTMPANPFEGQIVSISSSKPIATFTLLPNTGQVLLSTPVTMGAPYPLLYLYGPGGKWHLIA
jgi:hypothetical protein